MDSQTVITITILILISFLFLIAYINSKKVPIKKKEKIFERLEEIKIQINSNDLYARRDAIIKLDNLLGKALNLRYNNDINCGENLKYCKNIFRKSEYQQLWDVHKLRNKIVHNDEEISETEASYTYKIYKMGINKILK